MVLAEDADDDAWLGQLGPAYRQSDVARLLRKSKQAVSVDGRLLKLEMRNGDIGHPAFQFDGRQQLAGVRDIVAILGPVVETAWTIASWLTSPTDLDGSPRPVDLLRAGETEVAVALARPRRPITTAVDATTSLLPWVPATPPRAPSAPSSKPCRCAW